jgi:protein-tyrosine phosphatase
MPQTKARPRPQRRVIFDSIVNFRDIGGLATSDGRLVRTGVLFRSAILTFASDLDLVRLRNLRIGHVVDLRTEEEQTMHGRADVSRLRATLHSVSLFDRVWDSSVYDATTDPVLFLSERYDDLLENNAHNVVRAIESIVTSDAPTVFHCSAGKDRTGIIAALILGSLGVADHDVVADYEATASEMDALMSLMGSINPMFEEKMREQPAAFLSAPAEAMSRTLTNLRWTDGGAEQYLLRRGLPASTLEALRARLL